jgi:hypothetical protein
VQSSSINESDKSIISNLYKNREGLRVITLCKLTNLKKRVIYKRLNILKEKGLIENVYPIWKLLHGQVENCAKLLHSKNIFELHNLSYILKLTKVPDWWNKRKNKLMNLKEWNFKEVAFGNNGSNPYQQIINENFVIQTYPESIIIISRKRYYSNNPYEAITEAIGDVLDIISYLEERFKFKLLQNELQALEIRNNDYLRMKDHLAEHCKKEGHRFLVELDSKRKVWVDYSEPFGKESNYPEGQEILEKVTKDYLLNKPMLNSELQSAISTLTQVQLIEQQNKAEYSRDLVAHKEAIKQMGNNTDANTKSTELLAQSIKDMQIAFIEQIELLREEIKNLKTTK